MKFFLELFSIVMVFAMISFPIGMVEVLYFQISDAALWWTGLIVGVISVPIGKIISKPLIEQLDQ